MASGAQSVIWRVTSTGAEPTGTTGTEDIIEFNAGAVVNKNGFIMNTRFTLSSSVAVNEMPASINKLQDTGVGGIIIYVTGSIEDPQTTAGGLKPAHKFKTWMLEDKTNAAYPKGRFGLKNLNIIDVPYRRDAPRAPPAATQKRLNKLLESNYLPQKKIFSQLQDRCLDL